MKLELKLEPTEGFEFFGGQFESLDDQLAYAKAHSFKVRLEYDRRFRVWSETLLRDRRLRLSVKGVSKDALLDLAHRFVVLDIKDVIRLYKRAEKEFFKEANDPDISDYLLKFYQADFRHRQKMLVLTLHRQLTYYEGVTTINIIDQIVKREREGDNDKYRKTARRYAHESGFKLALSNDQKRLPTKEMIAEAITTIDEMRSYYSKKSKRGE